MSIRGSGSRKRGFNPSGAQREWVAQHARLGISHRRLAALLGIARNTLERHFSFELESRRLAEPEPIDPELARLRLTAMVAMYDAAMRGNVSAMKAFLRARG